MTLKSVKAIYAKSEEKMNQLLKYLQREGVYATLDKVKNIVLGHNKSCTVFLKNNGGGDELRISGILKLNT